MSDASGRRTRSLRLLAVAVTVGVVAGSLGIGTGLAVPAGAPAAPVLAALPSAAPVVHPSVPVGISGNNSTANATGKGVFYNTTSLPAATLADQTCVYGSCYDTSNDVATTVTPSGLVVAAYTIFSDQSPCASLRPSSVSNIAVVTSATGGRTWSGIHYVGNPVCAQSGYPDAWQPTLATLSNGTLVLAYVEYGLPSGELPLSVWPPTESRLVLSESFDNGSAWSTPLVLNISNPSTAPPGLQFTPAFPSVATVGQTIYVTWMSLTTENAIGSVALMVSTNGGSSWSPTIPVASGYQAGYSMDPQATIGPGGELVIAYTANVTQSYGWCTPTFVCYDYFPPVWVGSVWVATSSTNGTVFNYSQVATNLVLGSPGWDPAQNPVSYSPFETPAPQVAYSNATGQLFVAFSAGQPANQSTYCYYGQDECFVQNVFFYNSSNGGSTWSPGAVNATVLNASDLDPSTFEPNATDSIGSVAIATSGDEVDLEASYYNGTLCAGVTCGINTEVVFSTTDNGSTFTAPATIAADYTPYADAYAGEYTSIAEVNGNPRFFWTLSSCPGWSVSPCGPYPYSNLAASQVVVSQYFHGATSATLSFVSSGILPGTNWSVDVLGNERAGLENQTLQVSGVPLGVPIYFSASAASGPDVRYTVVTSGVSPASPVTLSANTTVQVPFERFVPVTIAYDLPNIQGPVCYNYGEISGCPSFYPGCLGIPYGGNYTEACYSYYFNPVPPYGPTWVPAGALDTIGLTPFNLTCYYPYGGAYGYTYCFIYDFYIDPLGWAGTGPGSVSTSSLNVSFVPEGPVTETASFLITGFCMWYYDYFPPGAPYIYNYGCGNFTGALTIEEQGLPAGTTWGVDLGGAAGTGSVTALAGQEIYNASADIGEATITPWTVPSSTPGEVWVGTPSIASPMLLPLTSAEVITYHLENLSSLVVPVQVDTLGLPGGIAGNATFTNEATGAMYNVSAGAGGASLELPGGDYLVNATTVATTDGAAYVPREVYGEFDVVGAANQSGTVPEAIELDGAATITLAYGAEYWVSTSAGPGGTVTPASEWVSAGSSVVLTATPNAGYNFLGWYGRGPGSTSGPEDGLARVAIQPSGPISELATFGPAPPPSYTVTVLPTGVPAGQSISVELGSTTYSGAGSFRISNLSAGTYQVTIPDVAAEGTSLERFVLSSLTASGGLNGNELTLSSDVSILPQFYTQYLVQVGTSGDGTLNVPSGSEWVTANATLAIQATPDPGWTFSGWWLSENDRPAALVSSSPDLAVLISTSATVIAAFSVAPVGAAASYTLTVNETGLPYGASWGFTLSGAPGLSGTAASLTESGLIGNHALDVGLVYSSLGFRYMPSAAGSQELAITANTTVTVAFTLQVLVTVSSAGSGSASGGGWTNTTQPVTISAASPPVGWQFVGWQGTGSGNYTGSALTATVTPTGPVTETATYAPIVTSTSSSSTPWTDYLAVGLVAAVLLGAGIAEGWLTGRKRPPVSSPPKGGAGPTTRSIPSSTLPPIQGPRALPPAAAGGAPPAWSESGTESGPASPPR